MRLQGVLLAGLFSAAALLSACTSQTSTGPAPESSIRESLSSSSTTAPSKEPDLPLPSGTATGVPGTGGALFTVCLGSENEEGAATLFDVVMVNDKYLPEDESVYRSWTRADLSVKNTDQTVPVTWSTGGVRFYFSGAWGSWEVEADPGSYKFFVWQGKDVDGGPATEIFSAGPLMAGDNGTVLALGQEGTKKCT